MAAARGLVANGVDFLRSVARSRPMPVRLEIVDVPDRYVSSESSALVNFLNNGPGLPLFTPPRMSERGVSGRPTLVSNVETLAHIALIARHGARWYRSQGSSLATVTGSVLAPGVFELPPGASLGDLLSGAGLADPAPQLPLAAAPRPVLSGGYFGTWVTDWSVPVQSPVVVVPVVGACGLAETARLLRQLAGESAGQCGPCFKPEGATGLAASALRVFADDVRRHARTGPCTAALQAVTS
jgi:NADH:ubiquinone oxidoreductase subunit F (NADH-binding)